MQFQQEQLTNEHLDYVLEGLSDKWELIQWYDFYSNLETLSKTFKNIEYNILNSIYRVKYRKYVQMENSTTLIIYVGTDRALALAAYNSLKEDGTYERDQ